MKRHYADFEAALRSSIIDLVRQDTGQNEAEALRLTAKILAAIPQHYRGGKVYVPKGKEYDRDAVLADINKKLPVRAVCRRHRIGMRTYYALLQSAQQTRGS